MTFPKDSIQSTIYPSPWWVKSTASQPEKGELVRAFVPLVDQLPHKFKLAGRHNPEEHDSAQIEITPLRYNDPQRQSTLPVAAMPLAKGELWTAYRAKARPCLILCDQKLLVEKSLVCGKPKWQSAPTFLVAPYYGADEGADRSGFGALFQERIQYAVYPQLMRDMLPLPGSNFSILRLDQLQPIGAHYQSFERTGFRLSEDASLIVEEWLDWLITGTLPEELYTGVSKIDPRKSCRGLETVMAKEVLPSPSSCTSNLFLFIPAYPG